MKQLMILFVAFLLILSFKLSGQTKADSLAVEKACRDYVEGWAEGNVERVAKGVSPELTKRTVSQDKDGISFTNDMSASLLLLVTKRNKDGVRSTDLEPDKPFKLDVTIYDITADYALAKTVNTKYGFFDYCQLAKINGNWNVINVLWGWLPQKKK
jgi:outer membrane lipoprotein-sorting protein